MKIDLSLKEIKYLKDVMLFQRLIDPKEKEIALDIVVKLTTILDAAEEIRKEDNKIIRRLYERSRAAKETDRETNRTAGI